MWNLVFPMGPLSQRVGHPPLAFRKACKRTLTDKALPLHCQVQWRGDDGGWPLDLAVKHSLSRIPPLEQNRRRFELARDVDIDRVIRDLGVGHSDHAAI